MGDPLAELEQILRSRKVKLTEDEENILRTCKAKSVCDFSFSAGVSSGVVWTATRRLSYGYRIILSGGAAVLSGMWRFDRSLNSCLDQILALEGTRMQWELANLILTKHRDDRSRMQLVNKHYYYEEFFDDSRVDRSIERWRHRNFFGDHSAQRTNDQSYDEKPDSESRNYTMSLGDVVVDPLDCILGYSGMGSDEIHHTDTVGISPKRRSRSRRRAHRQDRAGHQDLSSGYTSPQNSHHKWDDNEP